MGYESILLESLFILKFCLFFFYFIQDLNNFLFSDKGFDIYERRAYISLDHIHYVRMHESVADRI